MKKTKRLPNRIYVKWHEDLNGTEHLSAEETTADMEHGEKIGIYVLNGTKTVYVKKDLR